MLEKFNADDYYFLNFMEQFLTKREKDARRNLASISSVCSTLASNGTELSGEELKQYLNLIMTSCCSMMKMTELYTRMIKALFNSDISFQSFDLNKYMKEFSSNCNETLGRTCSVKYRSSDDIMFISTSIEFFEYIILGCVRRSVINGASVIEITAEKLVNNDIVITFGTVTSDPDANRIPFNDIDINEFIDINSSLAKKINSHFTYDNNVIQLKVDYKLSDNLILKSPEVTNNPNVMTSFHSMLADLSGYEFY